MFHHAPCTNLLGKIWTYLFNHLLPQAAKQQSRKGLETEANYRPIFHSSAATYTTQAHGLTGYVNVAGNHHSPGKFISCGHFIEQFPRLITSTIYQTRKNRYIFGTQVPLTHVVKKVYMHVQDFHTSQKNQESCSK